MRRILAATILVSPLFLTAAAHASQPVTDAPASTTARPISTGVVPAHVLYSPNIDLTPAAAQTLTPDAEVVLTLNVNEKGHAEDVEVVKSPSHYLDGPVAAAVRQYRFRPATLDNQPVTTPMTLTVVVEH
ncbi:MAG: TonB family protein [Terracidiphilus sp.]|jgi:TonB family protein